MRRPLLRPLALGLLLVAGLAGPSPAHAAVPERVIGYSGGGSATIVSVRPGTEAGTVVASFAGAGFVTRTGYRIIGNATQCGQETTALSRTFSVDVGIPGTDGVLLAWDRVGSTAILPIASTRSIHLGVPSRPGTTLRCLSARAYAEADPSLFTDLSASLGEHRSGTIRGMTLFIHGDRAHTFNAVLRGLPAGSVSRIAAIGEPCETPLTSAEEVIARRQGTADAAGVLGIANAVDPQQSDERDGEVRCHAILKGASGLQVRRTTTASRWVMVP